MMKKTIKIAALAASLAAPFAASASGVNGDIYDIRPCTYDSLTDSWPTSAAWATADNPLRSGTKVYFKIRLIQGAQNDSATTWKLSHPNGSDVDRIIDDAMFPLKAVIYVSGQEEEASLVDCRVDSPAAGFTELVFSYTTKSGDFALPVVFATTEGPASTMSDAATLLFRNTDKWAIVNDGGEAANFWQWKVSASQGLGWVVTNPDTTPRPTDYTLANAGIYVKTVDFDSNWEVAEGTTGELWRSFREGSTVSVGAAPALAAIAPVTNAVTFYVWSSDESAVRIKNGVATDIVTDYVDGVAQTVSTQVGTITIDGGLDVKTFEDAGFPIEGVSMTGGASGDGAATLILSQWPNFLYRPGSYERIADYIEVPVKCVEPLPASVIAEVDRTTAYAKVGDGWMTNSAVLDVYLSQALEEDIDVTVTPSMVSTDGQTFDMSDYVRFSTSPTVSTIASLTDTITVTIKAGDLRSKDRPKIYLYFLRADEYSSKGTIDFTPSIPDAQKASTGLDTADRFIAGGVRVDPETPEVSLVDNDTDVLGGFVAGTAKDIKITVSDTYAAQQIASGTGYTVEIQYNDTLGGYVALDGNYYIGTGGFLRDEDGKLPQITFPTSSSSTSSGYFTTRVRVTDPINRNQVTATVLTSVKAAKTVSVSANADAFNEGDTATFTIQLDADNDTLSTLYAFLIVGPDDVKKDMFSARGRQCVITPDMTADDLARTSGVVINPEQGGPGKEVQALVRLLDGDAIGSTFSFSVAICSTPAYSAETVLAGYNTNYANITVDNVEPSITRIEMNQNEPADDGYFEGSYPLGQEQTFQAIVKDPGSYDLLNGFKTRWRVTRVGGGVSVPVKTIEGNPNDEANVYTLAFTQAGTYKIVTQVMDKDMDDWSALVKETYVVVVDQPQLSVALPESPNETSIGQVATFGLGGYYNAAVPMVMMVTVIPPSDTANNVGILEFDSSYSTVPTGYETLAESAIAAEGSANYKHYYLTFRGTETQDLAVTAMDGTRSWTVSAGFKIKAQILNDGVSSDGVKPWSSYYLASTKTFRITNVAPEVTLTEPSTNAWEVAGGAATSYPIRWTVRSDVDNDYTGLWDNGTDKGIHVTFSGCDNADEGEAWVTNMVTGSSGTFIPNFGSSQGPQVVTITIEDKDGGYVSQTYRYEVQASKFLTTSATGPFGGTSTSDLVSRYSDLGGGLYGSLGMGHTYVDGATFSSAKNFRLRWNCGKNTQATIYAFGYKVANPSDGGSLDGGLDVAVDPTGYAVAGTRPSSYYTYPWAALDADDENRRDSFFYCWIQHTSSDGSSIETSRLGDGISPEIPGTVASAQIGLPSEKTDDEAYVETEVEAIFAREWLPADNLGDINADGIPDVFAMRTWKGGNLIELAGGDKLENDLMDLSELNPDESYLPGICTHVAGTALVDDSANSYAPIGVPFTTRLEIRGFHEGLNAQDVTTSDVSFSADEELAWKWYAAQNSLDPDADRKLSVWSPEPFSGRYPRMDPTIEDTDGDGFPDSWEYYFWYMAHVWRPARLQKEAEGIAEDKDPGQPREGQKYIFERFTLDNITEGVEIPLAEVEERFNPCVPFDAAAYADNPDFDNDGLSDLEELAIGTNPCHWDTDGDRLCDAWEVMMCLDPLNGEMNGNPDGDYMAYRAVRRDMGWIDPEAEIVDPAAEGARIYGLPELSYRLDYGIEIDAEEMSISYVALRDLTVQAYSFTPKFKDGERLVYGRADDIPDDVPADWIHGYYMVDKVRSETVVVPEGSLLLANLPYVLIHDQVRDAFGFDPRTAWNNVDGYVSDRWNPRVNENVRTYDHTGVAVNTRPYQNYDEYLLLKYRLDYGIHYTPDGDGDYDPGKETMWAFIRRKTTNPNVVVAAETTASTSGGTETDGESAESGESTEATSGNAAYEISQAVAAAFKKAGSDKAPIVTHGADTNENGVPDGWMLYNFRNPSVGDTDYEDGAGHVGARDFDGDTLSLAAEFAGTDSCNAYASCSSISNNHPGALSGWFNKFFPTNPGTVKLNRPDGKTVYYFSAGNEDGADTDGDGVTDAQEGGSWREDFYNHGRCYRVSEGKALHLSFVYGSIEDNGTTLCFRGGGMNPCSIDTDLDGLPDGWEMQHAGVPVDAATRSPVSSDGINVGSVEFDRATWIADGIYAKADAYPEGTIYIAGGMDATWGGDAQFDDRIEGNSYDELLGVERDVDFDHDGLQNWQEYMTQAIRHFRYDDISTPLMGRQLEEGAYSLSGALASPHTQSFGKSGSGSTGTGFPVFDPADPETFAANAAEAWYGREFVEYVTVTTGVRQVLTTVDETTGETSTNIVYYTAQKKVVKDGATLAEAHASAGGTLYQEAWNEAGWRNLGYFAPPRHSWDPAVVSGKIAVPLYMMPVTGSMSVHVGASVAGYATTDPRMADTDGDGLDDYYELFHGLNPLLGTTPDTADETEWTGGKSGDIVAAQYWMAIYPMDSRDTFNAYLNEWIYPSYSGFLGRHGLPPGDLEPIAAPQAYDFVLYPWTAGSPLADCDGDGIRNDEERIAANLADPMPRHTDPTPLWFTERTTPASFTAQYYALSPSLLNMPWGVGTRTSAESAALKSSVSGEYAFSFEENEGYDTDGDFVSDATEAVSTIRQATDPLVFDDPKRSQALYLDGVNSLALSKDPMVRPANAADFLKQFTVECWVMPEKTGAAQTIVERSTAYDGASMNSDATAIRANFRIGLDAQGRVYGMFDNNDAVESGLNAPTSCQFVDGGELPLGGWSHVALTFDGSELAIYVNGAARGRAPTTLIPANGVSMVEQYPGATNSFPAAQYRGQPSAVVIGARPKRGNLFALYPYLVYEGVHLESFDNYQEFYKGYVDEVRVWDGARTAAQIRENYARSLSFADAAENRETVFTQWAVNKATRNSNDGNPDLPAELVLNYTFSTLPGAVDSADVAKTPAGFSAKVLGAAMSDYATNGDVDTTGLYDILAVKGSAGDGSVDGDMLVGWWSDSEIHSTVYDDYHVVPWIKNTVAHLAPLDGAAPDSFLYSSDLGAVYTLASDLGVSQFVFPNTANPYPETASINDAYYRAAHSYRLRQQLGDAYDMLYQANRFQVMSTFTGTSDLVPLGGAFAKTCTEMWDGLASDPWEQTGEDLNMNGIPDWWDEYARNNYSPDVDPTGALTWNTPVEHGGRMIPAGKAFVIDLNRGMQPDGTIDSAYANYRDDDGNGIPDWWENLFGIAGGVADDDSDGDGLSNYVEYLLSEVYDLGVEFDPTDAYSVTGYELDYFYKIGSLYAGEIFTDHDMVEDWLEDVWGTSFANRYAWDALADRDEDGWSNFAEARYYNFTSRILAPSVSHSVGDAEVKDMPVPTIDLTVRYNGQQPLTATSGSTGGSSGGDGATALAPLVVQTYTDADANGNIQMIVPDATFTVQPGATVPHTLYLGAWHDGTVQGTLAPGYVNAGSFTIDFAPVNGNDSYFVRIADLSEIDAIYANRYPAGFYVLSYDEYRRLYDRFGGAYVVLQSPSFEWSTFEASNALTVTQDETGEDGHICYHGERIGDVNLVTGAFSLDLGAFRDTKLVKGDSSSASDGDADDSGDGTVVAPRSTVVRLAWESVIPENQSRRLQLHLGEADTGYVKEGSNAVVAFYDLNGDGSYTPGEPLGFASGVKVGWRSGKVEMELTDTSSVITRAAMVYAGETDSASSGSGDSDGNATGSSDRRLLYGTESGDFDDLIVGNMSGGKYETFNVVRTYVNGAAVNALGIANRTVLSRTLELEQRNFFFEGDVLASGAFDLDSEYFSEVLSVVPDVTSVTYRIVLGLGTTSFDATNNLYEIMTTRHFDAVRVIPEPVSPGAENAVLYDSHPVFRWRMPGGANTYTAFRIQIRDTDGTTVWTSGRKRVPARDADGCYVWESDAFVGAELENNKRYGWRVTMLNSKFQSAAYSEEATFRTNVPEDGFTYGKIPVCVKYFGPVDALNNCTVQVEAFETPDFTGTPAARAFVAAADKASVSAQGSAHEANATLIGLTKGKYYVRAFLDLENYGTKRARNAYEAWGYVCGRERNASEPFTPLAVEVTYAKAAPAPIDLYIEDVDTNGNAVPDTWEYVKNGGALYEGATKADTTLAGSVAANNGLTGGLKNKLGLGKVGEGLHAMLTTSMSYTPMAALTMGIEPSQVTAASDGTILVESKVESVEVTSISFDGSGAISLTVEGRQAGVESAFYEGVTGATVATVPATVTCRVYRKTDLASSGWGEPVAVQTVKVGAEPAEIAVPDDGVGSAFFKVEVE